MSRTLTTDMNTKINKKLATEPVIILGIDWTTVGTKYYGDKTMSPLVEGRVMSVSNFDISKQNDNYGTLGQLSVVLSDHDNELYNIINSEPIENVNVTVYQTYEGLSQADWLVLFKGTIVAPIEWSEARQDLSFSVYSNYSKGEDVVSMVVPDFDDIATPPFFPNEVEIQDKASMGKVLPLVFGNVVCSETLRIATTYQTTTVTRFTAYDGINAYISPIKIDRGYEAPSGRVTVKIGEILFYGRVIGENFYVYEHNIPIDLAPYSAVLSRDYDDIDSEKVNVAWISTPSSLLNKWVLFFHNAYGYLLNFCINQEGSKCTFRDTFSREEPDYDEDQSIGPFAIFLDNTFEILQAAPYLRPEWPTYLVLEAGQILAPWSVLPGSEFTVMNASDVYCTNYAPHTTIKAVYAFRNVHSTITLPNGIVLDNGTTRQLVPVPSSYYRKRSTYGFNGRYVSALVFDVPLRLRREEQWEEAIYVVQSAPFGPNTAQIIAYLIRNFTTLDVDVTSFTEVETALWKYPSDFGVYETKKPLDMCREIAWQARCALIIENGVAYLKYLSTEPTTTATLDTSKIKFKSISLLYTDTESMYTRIKGTFYTNAALEFFESKRHYQNLRQTYYLNNTNKYGVKTTTWDFYIYSQRDYVTKSLRFWGKQQSESWKKVKLTGFHNSLKLEVFDCITLSFPTTYPLGVTTCKGIIESWSYDSSNMLIDMIVWLPHKAGTTTQATDYWVDDSSDGIVAFNSTIYFNEVDYTIPSYNDKMPPETKDKYGTVVAVYEETIEGVPTGVTLYDIDVRNNGLENEE